MAPKAAAVGEAVYTLNGVTMTPSDMRLIFGVLNSLTAPLEADLDTAAVSAGYTVGSFKKMWPTLKKKCNIDSVSSTRQTVTAPSSIAADDGTGEPISTPKKTPGGGARGRSSSKKADSIAMADGGPTPLTPGVPAGMDALSVADGFETPDTPSKSIFGGKTASSKKRTAADAADPDADATLMEDMETPAKKKKPVARKPRVTAKQKREAAAAEAAAAALATAPALTSVDEMEPVSDPADAGPSGDSIDVAIDEGGVSQADDAVTDSCEI